MPTVMTILTKQSTRATANNLLTNSKHFFLLWRHLYATMDPASVMNPSMPMPAEVCDSEFANDEPTTLSTANKDYTDNTCDVLDDASEKIQQASSHSSSSTSSSSLSDYFWSTPKPKRDTAPIKPLQRCTSFNETKQKHTIPLSINTSSCSFSQQDGPIVQMIFVWRKLESFGLFVIISILMDWPVNKGISAVFETDMIQFGLI